MKTYSKEPYEEKLVFVDCDFCGSVRYKPFWQYRDFSFVRCQSCGVLYQKQQPVQEELLCRYDEDYFNYEVSNEEQFFRLMLRGLEDIRFFDKIEGTLPSCKSFLDIGCATGKLLEHFRQRGWITKGVEVCHASALYGMRKRSLDIYHGTLADAGFDSESFDVIHASHVIEHLNQPNAFLAEVSRILKPGGWALVTTPNTQGFQAMVFGQAWRSAIADHLYLFSQDHLARALAQRGLVVRRSATWGGWALGARPRFLKPFLDSVVKRIGLGDVVLLAAQKQKSACNLCD